MAELSAASPRFAEIWSHNEVGAYGEGLKRIARPEGPLTMNFSTFGVDGAPGLALLVYTPAGDTERERVSALVEARRRAG